MGAVQFRKFMPGESMDCFVPILECWRKEAMETGFGVQFSMTTTLGTLDKLRKHRLLYVMQDGNGIFGFMGLLLFQSNFSREMWAEEKFFYVSPDRRGLASMRFLKYVIQQAKDLGASRFMITASALASSKMEKVESLYKRFGFEVFEHVYIRSL